MTILLVTLLACTIACKKDDPVSTQPDIMLDQAKVEQNAIGTWEGTIRSGNVTENMKATVERMTLGNKAAEGRYFDPTFACEFEWTYESFSNGRVTFREKTLHPNICLQDLAVIVYFKDEDFNTLYVLIIIDSQSFSGALMRK